MEKILKKVGIIHKIYSEKLNINNSFADLASRFASEQGTVCLMSGGDLDCARYHILAIKPWLTFSGDKNQQEIITESGTEIVSANPLDTLRFLINHFKLEDQRLPEPVSSGLFGYLSYDLKDCIEELPKTTINDLILPDIYFTAPSIIVVKDKPSDTITLFVTERIINGKSSLHSDIKWFKDKLNHPLVFGDNFRGAENGFKSNFKRPDYITAINKIKDYIKSGDIYQVNMSQRFITDFSGNPFDFFKSLYKKNPAPFFAYVNCGDHHIVSTSPERFIKQTGTKVETRPIKGTRPRGKNEKEDLELRNDLESSLKDDAELSMIVDLMRNDIGKVCKSNSVKVVEHKRVEAYQNVFHLISIVEGELQETSDPVDLIKATFPGGSITGCPKIRSMEIIDELESNVRHIYTGSIGYISFHDTMDFSIAIRTATIINNNLVFSVGGGIVYDSDPDDEYDETIHKGQTLLYAFSKTKKNTIKPEMAWINGLIKPLKDINIPVTDLGIQYGFGFFETIRVDNGHIFFLEAHLERLKTAWNKFYHSQFPELSFELIINSLIEENKLQDKIAVVKILTTNGSETPAPLDNSIIITAKEYRHRLQVLNKNGIDLVVYPEPRQSNIADFKSCNYLYYYLAGMYAKENGGDEALILNPDGSVSETNTANILFIKDNTVFIPDSPNVLPGIMQTEYLKKLKTEGFAICSKKVFTNDLITFDNIIVTNSLMGPVKIKSINGYYKN